MRTSIVICFISFILVGNFPTAASGQADELESSKVLKHKIAIGRFSNETRYGKSLLRDQDLDPLGKQASDILAAYLTQANKFLIFERPDLSKIEREQDRLDKGGAINVDTLVVGSIVEFGTNVDGQRGLFNRKKIQRAHAKVAVRLIDVRTGLVFHSATGSGEATTETKTVLGIGSTSRHDGTLTDKAISVAVEDMIEELINTITDRPWRTSLLQVQENIAYIAGGKSQGLHVGDRLYIMQEGETIRSQQTGFDITLPGQKLAEIEITSLFGDNETNEGAVTSLISGQLPTELTNKIFITDKP